MTVKSPFYNKPSTSTSVDSCHKCPLISPVQSQVSMTADFLSVKKDQPVGFDQSKVPDSFNNPTIEPSNSSVADSENKRTPVTSCSNCGTQSTPMWRRSPMGDTICNACGLYFKSRNTSRPVWLKMHISKPKIAPRQPPLLAPATQRPPVLSLKSTEGPLKCTNCKTSTTPLWRRDGSGQPICNACGLYYKLHNVHRPVAMKRTSIKRRKRTTPAHIATHKTYQFLIKTDNKQTLRPLLPSPSPEPIEEVRHKSSNIACLLNPEVDLPSPPMAPHDDIHLDPSANMFHPMDSRALEAHRDELKREVCNLTSLLSRTTAMLQNIDQAMATFKK